MTRDQHTPMPDSSLGEIAQGIQSEPTLDPESKAFLEAALAADTVPPGIADFETRPPIDDSSSLAPTRDAIKQDPNAPIAEIDTLPPLKN